MCDSSSYSSLTTTTALTPQQLKRKVMYKTSPNWQQLYREQCITTLRDKRQETRSRLVDRFRNIDINDNNGANDEQFDDREKLITEVMKSVWNQYSDSRFPDNDDSDQSDICDFMEQIRQQLINEEVQYWEDLLETRGEEELEWRLADREPYVYSNNESNVCNANNTSNDLNVTETMDTDLVS